MQTFGDISNQLDAALKDVATKKAAFDEASKAVTELSNQYTDSVNKAQTLRLQLTSALEAVLPSNPNVRQSL